MNNELTDNEVNKIIAEFMGDPKQEKVYVNCPSLCSCELCERPDLIYPESLLGIGTPYYFQNKTIKYTKSLDSLVPVWNMIDNDYLNVWNFSVDFLDHKYEFCIGGYCAFGNLSIQQAAAHATAKAILELKEIDDGDYLEGIGLESDIEGDNEI